MLLREIKEDLSEIKRYIMFIGVWLDIVTTFILPKVIYIFNAVSIQTSHSLFIERARGFKNLCGNEKDLEYSTLQK